MTVTVVVNPGAPVVNFGSPLVVHDAPVVIVPDVPLFVAPDVKVVLLLVKYQVYRCTNTHAYTMSCSFFHRSL